MIGLAVLIAAGVALGLALTWVAARLPAWEPGEVDWGASEPLDGLRNVYAAGFERIERARRERVTRRVLVWAVVAAVVIAYARAL
jgi:hypothetical protein